MLRWAIVFLVIALVAGLLGFTGIAGQPEPFAVVLFFAFYVLFIAGLVYGLVVGGKGPAGA